jgi:hypothetical protein
VVNISSISGIALATFAIADVIPRINAGAMPVKLDSMRSNINPEASSKVSKTETILSTSCGARPHARLSRPLNRLNVIS